MRVVAEPLAAAVGAGLDLSLPYAEMIVDVGAGVTDIAVIRSGELVKSAAVRTACCDFHTMVQQLAARRYGVILYRREAERLTREFGWSREGLPRAASVALGVERAGGGQAEVSVTAADVAEAIRPALEIIRETLRRFFRGLAHDLAAEVIESGVCLTGGGACIPGIKELIAAETSLDVRVAPDPLRSVISGAGQMLDVGADRGLWRGPCATR